MMENSDESVSVVDGQTGGGSAVDIVAGSQVHQRGYRRVTGRISIIRPLSLLMIPLSIASAQGTDSTYRQHIAAARVSTPVVAQEHLLKAFALLHGHPDAHYLLARNAVRLDQPDAAIGHLRTIVAMGLWYDAEHDSVLTPLHDRADFVAVLSAMAANRQPISHATTVVTFEDPDLLAEDLAYDRRGGTFYASAVHRREIVSWSRSGKRAVFARTPWSPLALAVDAGRRTLWVTIAALPQGEGTTADSARTAVLAYDLATGQLRDRYDLPSDGGLHALGDMTLDAAGDPIVSDGFGGGVYRVDRKRRALSALVPPSVFHSPQTPAVAPDGRILVADYSYGVAMVDPATGVVSWIAHADTVAMNGIDGMYLVDHALYAIQNGTNPERVVRFDLDSSLRQVVDWSVVERATPNLGDPTHGVVIGDQFYFLANSGWDRFADDGHMTSNGAPARVVRVAIVRAR
jgi:sugar lactone lactonase YvrE